MLMLTSSSFETSPLICCSLLSAAGSWPQTLWGFSCPFLPSHCGRTEVEITGTCCCSWFLHRFRDLNLGSHVAQQVVYLLGDHPSPYNNLKAGVDGGWRQAGCRELPLPFLPPSLSLPRRPRVPGTPDPASERVRGPLRSPRLGRRTPATHGRRSASPRSPPPWP